MGRRRKELPPVEAMYAKIASILVPENILRDFDIYDAKENKACWVIEMREKSDRIPYKLLGFSDIVLDGYCDSVDMLSHSFACKPIYLRLFRLRYILHEISLLNRCLRKLTQSPEKWSQITKELMTQLFSKYKILKQAYDLSQNFKKWYDINNHQSDKTKIRNSLWEWYDKVKVSEIEDFNPVMKMLQKHEDLILNYFQHGHTNASAERLNGKIQRFVSANYGTRDKDFALYRIANYFS